MQIFGEVKWAMKGKYIGRVGVSCLNCKVVIYNYVLVLAYSMTKSVVIALIIFLVFLWDFIVLGLILSW